MLIAGSESTNSKNILDWITSPILKFGWFSIIQLANSRVGVPSLSINVECNLSVILSIGIKLISHVYRQRFSLTPFANLMFTCKHQICKWS